MVLRYVESGTIPAVQREAVQAGAGKAGLHTSHTNKRHSRREYTGVPRKEKYYSKRFIISIMEKVRVARVDGRYAVYELRKNGKWVLTKIVDSYDSI